MTKTFDSLALALAYLDRCLYTRYLFPIKAGAKFPPCLKDNLDGNCSNEPAQIIAWARKFPGCNWGVAHRKSGLLVVDVDTNANKGKVGQATFDALDLEYGWPATEETTTPSGGHHHIYLGWEDASHPAHIMALGKNGIGEDIDSPNYTLIPGCVFKDGTSYVGNNAEPVRCPEWVYDLIKSAKTRQRVANAGEIVVELDQEANIEAAITFLKEDAEPAIEGEGGDFKTLKTAMYLKDLAISENLAADLLNEYYNPRCVPAWSMDDLEKKVLNAWNYSSLSKVGGKTAEADFDEVDESKEPPIIPMGDQDKMSEQAAERKLIKEIEAARKKDAQKKRTRKNLIVDWVWIGRDERFVLRENTEIIWKRSAFDSMYRELVGKSESKSLSDTLLAQKRGSIQKYEGVGFKPGEGPTLDDGMKFNLYTPPNITPAEGDITWWTDHLEYLFPEPEYRDLVLNWMAWLLQNLSKKPKHALIVQGPEQGTGKSFLCWVLRRLVNEKNVSTVSQASLSGKFNSWALRAKLIVIEELRAVDRAEVKQNLHHLITEDVIDVERKGLDIEKAETCFGIFGMTNDDVALMLDDKDRRYLVVKTEAKPRSSAYYNTLYGRLNDAEAMGAVMQSLLKRDLGTYSGEQAAPATAAKADMLKSGASDLETFMDENRDTYPFNARLITLEDVIAVLPRRLEGRSPRLYSSIKKVLLTRFGGVELGQCTTASGSRPRVIAINGADGILRNQPAGALGKIYDADQKAKGKGVDLDDAENEFDNEVEAE